ncbi:hypothetical protein EV646_11725 [Kribbella antiqua]|uniref:Uncharacterized protein n=1 Tax=Kribbella antiqua TaxID=2512217 RepID=A0A4R2I820_9ACTN|nr:hypothetical protein [Kribbella antiqua]TCO40484.1 hypothetical protein EV646_11725 [Kribbella antiqua]
MNLRLHVHRTFASGWCVDIDDDYDRQPDDPYWCADHWPTLQDAIAAGCEQLKKLSLQGALARVSGQYDVLAA